MNINQAFPSEYLKASDFPAAAMGTISRVEMLPVGQDEEVKPVLFFKEYEKGMVLNKTNSCTLMQLYGEESDDWEGQSIVIFAATTDYQGKQVACIRLRAPKPQGKGKPAPAAAKPPIRQPQQRNSNAAPPPSDEDLSIPEETIPF